MLDRSRAPITNDQAGAPSTLSRLRMTLTALIGAVCVVWLGHVLWTRWDELSGVLDLHWWMLGLLLLLTCASHLQRALEFDFMLRRLDVREPFIDGLLLTGSALLLNYLPFSAGSVARAVALRRKHALRYASYVSALLVASLVNGQTASLCGLIASLGSPVHGGGVPVVTLLFAGLFVGGTLVVAVPASWAPRGAGIFAERIRDVSEGIALIRNHGSGIATLAALSFLKLLLNSSRMWICFYAFGINLPLHTLVLLGSAAVVVSLVNLAPGNMGVRELVLAALSGATGTSATIGAAAASLDRAVLLGYALVVGAPGLYFVRRVLRE